MDTNTIFKYWRLSLIAGLAVIAVVAALLEALVRTADGILDGTAKIWLVGKQIASNTVQVPLLVRVNQHFAELSNTANEIAEASGRIQSAASGSARKEG